MAIMEKRVLLGVQKTKVPLKRSKKIAKKRPFLAKLVHYLKSDHYWFAPLISSRSLNNMKFKEEKKEDEKKMVKKVGDYLMSDSYMYASLVHTPPKSFYAPPKVSEPQAEIKRVTSVEVKRQLVSPKAKNSFAGLTKDCPSQAQKEIMKHGIEFQGMLGSKTGKLL